MTPWSKSKLTLIDQFFMVMIRLRLALGEMDLAHRFSVSQSTVSWLVLTWANLMYPELKKLPVWSAIDKLQPPASSCGTVIGLLERGDSVMADKGLTSRICLRLLAFASTFRLSSP